MSADLSRRDLFAALSVSLAAAGIDSPVFSRAVAVAADKPAALTVDSIKEAEWVAGLELSEADRKAALRIVTGWRRGFLQLRDLQIGNAAPMPLVFNPAPAVAPGARTGKVELSEKEAPKKPDSDDELAFLSLTALAGLVRTKKVSSVELTKLYLKRLKDYDPTLQCVVNLTEETALEQA